MSNQKRNTDEEKLRKKLTPVQFQVTQRDGTEPAFKNEYWNNKREGIYVDIVSGEPLFSSKHKYQSGTGWPSFYQPLEPDNLVYIKKRGLFTTTIEVRSKKADSHLGHVFDDGPAPTYKRYCMNSAAMKFIPKEELAAKGYGKYLSHFKDSQEESLSAKEGSLKSAVAYFAAGCFWCAEADFHKVRGVKDVISGYLGGAEKNPTYEQVSSGHTGHAEAVKVIFDPNAISYTDLLKVFWLNVDPTVKNRQFCDVGKQYRSAIFYIDRQQSEAAKESLSWLKENFPNLIPLTEITMAKDFYKAEDYHQDYAQKNPIRYKFYRYRCGRDKRLDQLYGNSRHKILHELSKNF